MKSELYQKFSWWEKPFFWIAYLLWLSPYWWVVMGMVYSHYKKKYDKKKAWDAVVGVQFWHGVFMAIVIIYAIIVNIL